VFDHADAEEHLPVVPMPVLTPAANHAPVTATGY